MRMPIHAFLVLLLTGGLALGAGIAPPAPAELSGPPAQAVKTPSGLASVVLAPGLAAGQPGPRDYVTVHYTIWTPQGRMVDSTALQGEPLTLSVDRIMKGMAEGVMLMTPGERRRFWIPGALGFPWGKTGLPTGDLVMEMELVSMDPPINPAPADLLDPSPDSKLTSSGLVYQLLRHSGTATQKPRGRDNVMVQYTGWTTDGKVFDSTFLRHSPTGFQVNEVIKGWTEGLKLMVVGDKMRFWIPEKLAYRGEEGKPAGTLIFDVELLKIWP